MPKQLTVAVSGATGRQGGALARLLLSRGHTVRALTRTPASAAAHRLQSLGARICEADLEDGAAVDRAVEGADAFFLMATPFEAGTDSEIRQACTAATAAKDAGVKHLVYSSVASADRHTGIPHFDSKASVEGYLRNLGVPFSIVGPVFFMENLLAPELVEGLRAGTLALPLPPRCPLQLIAVEDVARFAALVLERPSEFDGVRIDIASDTLTGPEVARALSRASGSQISFAEAPLAAVRARSADLARMWAWFDEVGYDVDLQDLARTYPDVGWHDLARWARAQDWSVLDVAGPEQPTA